MTCQLRIERAGEFRLSLDFEGPVEFAAALASVVARFEATLPAKPPRAAPWRSPARRRRISIVGNRRSSVIERDGLVCGICKGVVPPGDVHIDHIVPLAQDGSNDLENLQVAHAFCNLSKGAR